MLALNVPRPLAAFISVTALLSASSAQAISSSTLVTLAATDGREDFGTSVAGAGDINGDGFSDLIVGAPGYDQFSSRAGRAYVFYGGAGADSIPDLILTGATGENLGRCVTGAGDVNDDGFADFAVSKGSGGTVTGVVYVYYGGPVAIPRRPLIGAPGESFGSSIAGCGDVNGDGFPDLLIGAERNDAGGVDAGAAFVYYGGPGADATPDLTLTGRAAGDHFGTSVSGAGDVNGDGFADLIVGANFNNGTLYGAAYIYYGGPGVDATADLTLTGAAHSDYFGRSVAGAGDINGDGFADLIVGAPFHDTNTGQAYIYLGGPGADATADLTLTGAMVSSYFGWSVAGTGDVDGDGFVDVMVGAWGDGPSGSSAGSAYIYFGGPGTDANTDLVLTGTSQTATFGWSVASAGDVNDDGLADMIVGDLGSNQRAYVMRVNPTASGLPDPTAITPFASWPNPARGQATFAFEVDVPLTVTVTVHDLAGREVARPIVGESFRPGQVVRSWRPEALPGGVYFIRALVGEREHTRSLIWLGNK